MTATAPPPTATDTSTAPALALRGLVKHYGAVRAVDGLDLEVPAGICLGLLGPNGAGKSTTMKMLTSQALPDAGEIEVLGHRLPDDAKAVRALMGVVPQADNLDIELTARQNLVVFARLYRVPRSERRDAVDRALELARLTDRADTRVDALSGGMRRRLLLARGLVHRPHLVLLDEPTVGLDPQVRQQLWTLIDDLRSGGTTVLMSTHYIEEAERLADEVAVVSRGRVIARGRPADLVAEHAGTTTLECFGPPERLAAVEERARERGAATRRNGPSVAVLRAEELGEDFDDGPSHRRVATLEDVFVLLTGSEGAA